MLNIHWAGIAKPKGECQIKHGLRIRSTKKPVVQACVTEDDPETAFSLLTTLHLFAADLDPDDLEVIYSKTLMLCFECEILCP